MWKRIAVGAFGVLIGAGEAGAVPTINLLPAQVDAPAGTPGIVLTVQLVNDLDPSTKMLIAYTFGIERTSGDAVMTGGTRQVPPGSSTVGASLSITPTSVFTFGGVAIAGPAVGTYTLGTVTITAGTQPSWFQPVQRPTIDVWYFYDYELYKETMVSPVMNGALIVPEPASGGLIAVGLVGLVLAGTRGSR